MRLFDERHGNGLEERYQIEKSCTAEPRLSQVFVDDQEAERQSALIQQLLDDPPQRFQLKLCRNLRLEQDLLSADARCFNCRGWNRA
jgi:hypothetical protein